QALGDAVAVVGYHRIGGGEDRLRGAVVLLQLDHVRVGEVLLEVEDVAHVRAPETVDRLAVVANNGRVGMAGETAPVSFRGGLTPAAGRFGDASEASVYRSGKQLQE